jgi:hypothetical protein
MNSAQRDGLRIEGDKTTAHMIARSDGAHLIVIRDQNGKAAA